MDNRSIRKLESELWESADLLRAGSKLTSNQYCMPVLGLIFLRYAYSRFKLVEAEILSNRPSRGGRVLPVESSDFAAKSALFLPKEAQYDYLVNLPENIAAAGLLSRDGQPMNSRGEVVNNAMALVEEQSEQLAGVLPKDYTIFSDELLSELLRIFNNSAMDDVGGDVIGRIYEYFLNKFAKNIASDDGVFFTPKSLVKMIVNILEPKSGVLLDPACGSGGMFVQTGDFVNNAGMSANTAMTFYGQEKVEYNAQLCLMNMAVHGLTGVIKSGDEANTFYHDAHNLAGCCDYVMANPPFNVDKVKSESCESAGRLPFGLPGVNKSKEVGNANYLWISYFYAYLNETGRAGFVMASSATDSQGRDRDIRQKLVETGHVDVMVSVGNNFFYTKSLPCSLWFFDKGKDVERLDKVLFIDARNYYTVVDRTLNEWTDWQLRNLNAIVWLYRGQHVHYEMLIANYRRHMENRTMELQESDLVSVIRALEDSVCWSEMAESDRIPTLQLLHSVNYSLANIHDRFRVNEHTQLVALEELKQDISNLEKAATSALKHVQKGHFFSFYSYKDKESLPALRENSSEATKRKIMSIVIKNKCQGAIEVIDFLIAIQREYFWLTEKFGINGEYRDIPGLCKIAYTTKEAQGDDKDGVSIEEKGWSLTPGAYVGVAPVEDDGVDFKQRMAEIRAELLSLQAQSNELMETISRNLEGLGL